MKYSLASVCCWWLMNCSWHRASVPVEQCSKFDEMKGKLKSKLWWNVRVSRGCKSRCAWLMRCGIRYQVLGVAMWLFVEFSSKEIDSTLLFTQEKRKALRVGCLFLPLSVTLTVKRANVIWLLWTIMRGLYCHWQQSQPTLWLHLHFSLRCFFIPFMFLFNWMNMCQP